MSIQSHMPPVRRSFVIAAFAVLLAACGSSTMTASPPVTDGPIIELRDDQFTPTELQVPIIERYSISV